MVSIIMAAYNAEAYIKRAIDSVIGQMDKDWELFVINDGSTNHTGQLVQSYTDKRIRYYKNKGRIACLNEPLIAYRNRQDSISRSDTALPDKWRVAVSKRILKRMGYKGKGDVMGMFYNYDGIKHTFRGLVEANRLMSDITAVNHRGEWFNRSELNAIINEYRISFFKVWLKDLFRREK